MGLRMAGRNFYCYILECADGTFYTGWTTDPQRRLNTHNRGAGARYTRARRPGVLVYVEKQTDRSEAMRRELQIKKLDRNHKKVLIENFRLGEGEPCTP